MNRKFRIELEATGRNAQGQPIADDQAAIHALRRLLKFAGRQLGLRCLSVVELEKNGDNSGRQIS